jgi:hypothetical protein
MGRPRKIFNYCKKCNALTRGTNKHCDTHLPKKETTGSKTLRHYIEKLEPGTHPSWRYSEVRSHARYVNRDRLRVCQVCGYARAVQFCHIKPLSTFDLDTPLSIVNAPENIAILCPNHHWELDHGGITPETYDRF